MFLILNLIDFSFSEDSLQVRKPRGWGNEKAVMEDLEEFDEDFSDDDHNEGRIDESKQIIQEGDLNDLLKEYDDDELGDLVEVKLLKYVVTFFVEGV